MRSLIGYNYSELTYKTEINKKFNDYKKEQDEKYQMLLDYLKLEEKEYVDQMKNNGVKVITLARNGFINPMFFLKLKKILTKEKFDIVHVHLFPNLYYLAVLKMLRLYDGIIVFTEHSTKNGRSEVKLFNLVEPFIYKYYDKIIAISNSVKSYLQELLPDLKDKIILINNGVDVFKYRNAMIYDKSQFIEIDEKGNDIVLLLMVSRFSEPKDQLSLINAMNFLDEHYVLLLVGEGGNMEECMRSASKFGNRVRFLGFRNDIPELMKTADINLLSTEYEGFSGVTLESLASGTPFLGANVRGINDVVPNENFLFKAGDAEDIAKKVMSISEDENHRDKMIEVALEHVNQFDNSIMIEKYLELYSELIKNKK
jgi:glycosyltransferase involved in cell wall biosynthesis